VSGRALAAILALGVAVLFSACTASTSTGPAPDQVRVLATTTVLADLVAQVGGPRVFVDSLVPRGGEVHTFDPRPSVSVKVSEARLIVMNGLGLDDWLGRLALDTGTGATILRLGEGLSGVTYLSAGGSTENPHLWLDVAYAELYVDRIGGALGALDPTHAAEYTARAVAYRARLVALDDWIRARVATIPAARRAFVSFHDALPYFARAYGLRVVGVVVPAPGQDPSAGEVGSLISAIRVSGVRAVFSEAQFNPELARTVATEAGATVVADLYTDTLGDPPLDSYEGIMRWDVDRIVGALR
jgi:ABC-type Zn uptake system ZnuABC Zn-binding protein ZnuA